MRISEYPLSESIGSNDVMVVETDTGTKKMKVKTLVDNVSGSGVSDTITDIVGSKDFSKIIDKIYPVGSLYLSYTNKSPANLFGGSWLQITDRFIRAANDTNTGGSDSVALTTAQMPSHSHTAQNNYYMWRWGGTTDTSGRVIIGTVDGVGYKISAAQQRTAQSSNYIHTLQNDTVSRTTQTAGGTSSVSTMPEYQDVYVWRRIS